MMLISFFIWLNLWLIPSLAVKDYLFKKCAQSGFCNRNRHFAEEVSKQAQSYHSRYSVDLSSLNIDDGHGKLDGIILKELNDGTSVDLSFNVSLLSQNSLRFTINEINREAKVGTSVPDRITKKRYDEVSKWALVGNPKGVSFKHELTSEAVVLRYGKTNEAHISLYPFGISIYRGGKLQLVANEQNMLNFEHYRTKASEEDEHSNDVSPEESTFDAYSDSFKDAKGDTLPFGPESVGLDFTFKGFTQVYGIPEHADSLALKDTSDSEPYRLYNVDIFEYPIQSKYPMYGSIPFMISVKPGASAGVFWLNSADTYIDISKSKATVGDDRQIVLEKKDPSVKTHWMSENGLLDAVLMVGDKPADILRAYTDLTGQTALPSVAALGYQQSRWNYNDAHDVLTVASSLDKACIPCDCVWLDIEYTDGKKYFTWNKAAFPDPDAMAAQLNRTGKNLVVIIDSHLKYDYEISDQVVNQNIAIRNSDGKGAYRGHCWPGESVWIDTLNPKSRDFWDKQYANGSELLGYSTNIQLWNDMNEPSVFNGPETTAPRNLLHYGGWEHRSIHNLYGLTFHEATYHALIKRNANRRPFILTRSFYPGSQRTAAMWSGDNLSTWEHLRESIKMCLTMNMMGYPMAGSDVGGFFNNPDPELLVRWYQAGMWYPFFRAHSHMDSRRREPYLIEDPYGKYIKDAVLLRYRLLPLLYTEFYKSSQTGSPVLAPLFYEFPENEATYMIDDEFFLGGLLVKPVMEDKQRRVNMYLPDEGIYYNFFNHSNTLQGLGDHSVDADISQIPVYVREGTILSTKDRYRRSSKLMTFDPYTIYITFSKDKTASGDLYVDDGESFGYRDSDDYIYVKISAESDKIESHIESGSTTGSFTSQLKDVKVGKIVLIGLSGVADKDATIRQSGKEWKADILSSGEDYVIRNPGVSISEEWKIEI